MADFTGTTGDDVQDGTAADETFDYSQGGEDFVRGLDGKDIFLMGAALDAGDSIHGGAGNDEVVLDGVYNLSFATETIVNVETLRLTAGHDYTMDTAEENILAGRTLTIDGSALGVADVLIFHGFSETDGMFSITAGAGADTIVGGDKADFIDGGAGDDSLGGGKGSDRLSGHEGMDNIFGGAGDDSIGGGDADDNLYGGDDNDAITDTKGNNHLYGEAGDDILTGGSGNDTLDGGTGVNTINGMGGDDTIAAVNADQAFGGDGNDSITFQFVAGNFGPATAQGGAGNDTISFVSAVMGTKSVAVDGGDGDDTVAVGSATVLSLAGGIGTDSLTLSGSLEFVLSQFDLASSGFETVAFANASISTNALNVDYDFSGMGSGAGIRASGSSGSDLLVGTSADDHLFGGTGDDTVRGGSGNDEVVGAHAYGDVGDDIVYGLVGYGGKGADKFYGGDGAEVYGGAGSDVANLAARPDFVSLGRGDDFIVLLGATVHDDVLRGGSGHDTIQVGYGGAVLDLAEFSASSTGCETLYGNFSLTGGAGDNVIDADSFGFTGSLSISGGDGDDVIRASHDSSAINGGAGNDTLVGGSGAYGGDGNDTITAAGNVSGDSGDDTITSFAIDNFSWVYGGLGNDWIVGQDVHTIKGDDGDDTIQTGGKYVYGGNGNDTIITSGEYVYGGDGNDTIDGGTRITGGLGSDSMVLNSNRNVCIVQHLADSIGANRDTIVSYDALQDHLVVHGHTNAILDSAVSSGYLSDATFDHDLMVAVDLTKLAADHAILFTPNAGDQAGKTFLIVDDNGQAGYQAGVDYVIEFDDATNMDQFTL